MKHDKDVEAGLAKAFAEVGDALIQILAASRQPDWEIRHRASESLGKAAAGVYRELTEEGAHPVG